MKYSSQKGMFLRTICNEKTFYREYSRTNMGATLNKKRKNRQ
jgi:hypothetical protein